MTGPHEATAGPPRGRTRVTPRALSRVVTAVTAEAFGTPVKHVVVELVDKRGRLSVSIATRIPMNISPRPWGEDELTQGTGESLLARSEQAQQFLRHRVAGLTGTEVGPITIRFTGTVPPLEARVR